MTSPDASAAGDEGTIFPRRKPPVSFRQFLWLWNRTQGFTTPELHLRIASWLEEAWIGGDERLLLMVFRDAGKSTLTGLFCSWLLAGDSDLRILVVAAEHGLATKLVRNVRGIFEKHPVAKALIQPSAGAWSQEQFTVRRNRESRDPSMLARGIGANLTGCRADLIICDDVEVPNTVATATKREDLRRRMGELAFILVPGGMQLCVGTPHSHDSIYADAEQLPADATPFLGGYNRLVLPIVDDAGTSRWPERFSAQKIRELEQEVGPASFKSQMLLQPVDLRDIRLDAERLQWFAEDTEVREVNRRKELSLKDRRLTHCQCWWDPAYGSPSGGDGSVVAVVFADDQGCFWLVDLCYLQHDPKVAGELDEASQLCNQVAALALRYHAPAVTLETNGIGKFLPNLLRKAVRQRAPGVVVNEHVSTRNKDLRIVEAFDPVLAARSLFVHERVVDTPFLDEMRNFVPGGRNRDDGLDAVAACLLAKAQPIGGHPGARPLGAWQADVSVQV